MTVALPVYPDRSLLRGLGFNVKWAPRFFNMPTAVTSSGASIDLALADEPLHDFELVYDHLHEWGRDARESLELRIMMGFFLQSGGTVGRFLLDWESDDEVAQQLVGTGDGMATSFTLVRSIGAGGFSATESVGALNTDRPFRVYLGESATPLDPGLYSVDTSLPKGQVVTLATAPDPGQEVRVDMSYYYYCKFADSTLTFEKFMERLWLLNSAKLQSCRPGA